MDLELARTFLQVVRTGSLIGAADKLHVTQTAVTARIKSLESQLNCRLFERNKAGARLTPDGERFLGYASQLVHTWEAACRDLPLPKGFSDLLAFGAESSLGNPLVLNWATRLREQMSDYAVRAELGDGEVLQRKLMAGTLDAAVVYEPDYGASMHVEQLVEEKLVQVRTTQKPGAYVYVDWGPEFRRQHDSALPEHAKASLYFNLGPLALQFLLQCGGSGYFRTRVVQSYIDSGVLERVDRASEFSYPVYLVYPKASTRRGLAEAIQILRDVVREDADWSQRWDFPG
jgi:DNA-binding transcriptional LysR family regulator